jgi:hypothetical protein
MRIGFIDLGKMGGNPATRIQRSPAFGGRLGPAARTVPAL